MKKIWLWHSLQSKYKQFGTVLLERRQTPSKIGEKVFRKLDFFSHQFLMENMISTLQNFLWENVSFADLGWITGKTNIIWGWFVWKQCITAYQPDHNILCKNQELRQSSNLGRAAGVPVDSAGPGSAAKLHRPGSKSPSEQLGNRINSGSVRAEVLAAGRTRGHVRACYLTEGVTSGENRRNSV